MENRPEFPGGLPEITSGWSGSQLDLMPGEGFWARVEQISVKGEMTRGLDVAMKGQPSPRIWLFLHPPGRGELSAAAAMSFARELAFRDQAALVLDGDDRNQALTRWTGRLEAEGWIDLARYGTSVLTSGIPMPFVGRRGYLLGVGSFAPTEVTGEEIDTLLTRLRRQADDLLIVAPSDSLGRMWAPAAGIRILCWDRSDLTPAEAATVAEGFEEAGCPLTALVSFLESESAAEELVEDVLTEVETVPETPEVAPASPPPPVEPLEPEVPEVTEEAEPVVSSDAPADEPDLENDRWQDLPLEQETVADVPGREEEGWVESDPVPESSGQTSRIFWFGALVAVLVIAAVSIYYFKFVRVPAEGHFGPIDIAAVDEAPAARDEILVDDPQEDFENGPTDQTDPFAVATDSVAVFEEIATEVAPLVSEITAADEAAPDTMAASGIDDTDAVEVSPTETESPAGPPPVFEMGPYTEPVGTKGWALHVFSFPDSASTLTEVKELDRRGFTSAVRIFDLGEKGRWRRVYLGSFSSRAEAKGAMPALLAKLRVDWAKPERFTTSAPE